MNLRELRELTGVGSGGAARAASPIERCHAIEDFRALARRRTPRPVFDYVEGGADEELSLRRNVEAFREWELTPVGPTDVSSVRTDTQLLGRRVALPLLCSPTGYTRMIHHSGELAVARAAARAELPYTLSTVASTSIEDVAGSRHPDLWFQLYIWRDRDMTRGLVERAWAAGYRVLEVSIDVAVSGFRTRDVRNGLTIPPRLTLASLLEIARKPRYWLGMVRNPAVRFANSPPEIESGGAVTIENMSAQFDPSVTWDDIAEVRRIWPGSMLIKGPLGADGAKRAIAAGVDGLHLSNHGGRQLDRLASPLDLLPEVREAVGNSPTIIVDSGIRHGTDLAIGIALGADAGAIGRAYLYGLMAGGEAGVAAVLRMLGEQFRRAMALLGVADVEELRARGTDVLRRSSRARVR